jgi:phosphoglycerate dehydrogenase-like enzyme
MVSSLNVVLIANDDHPIPKWVYQRFRDEGIRFAYYNCMNRRDLQAHASEADVLFLASSRKGLVVEENMDIFKRAGCVIKCGSGTDNIDAEACTRHGIIVAHTPEDPTESTSDHFIAMLFAAVRQTARQDRLVRRGYWSPKAALPIGRLSEAELGIIGFGKIGRMIVRKLSGFRMKIRVYDPYVKSTHIESAHCSKTDLVSLLRASQFVLVACPLTEETRGLIGEKEMKQMRSDAVLVNVARAGIVEEKALIKALKEDWIKAAAFDVVEKHPMELGDDFVLLENITFTPHMGGYSHHYPDDIFATSVEVIVGLAKGNMPPWIVNRDVKPKWQLS